MTAPKTFFLRLWVTDMPEPNKFLLSALAQDPLISSSLVPKNPQKDETTQAGKPGIQLEGISIHTSGLEEELSDLDLPSSVVDEIEVRFLIFNLLQVLHKFYYIDNYVTQRISSSRLKGGHLAHRTAYPFCAGNR